jgi:hypothetical protein
MLRAEVSQGSAIVPTETKIRFLYQVVDERWLGAAAVTGDYASQNPGDEWLKACDKLCPFLHSACVETGSQEFRIRSFGWAHGKKYFDGF